MPCRAATPDTCRCGFEAGLGVSLTGWGTDREPLAFNLDPQYVEAGSDTALATSTTGRGTIDEPIFLSVDFTPATRATLWARWMGTQAQYDALSTLDPQTIYVIEDNPSLPGVNKLYVGTQQVRAVYAGGLLVATEVGGVLVDP